MTPKEEQEQMRWQLSIVEKVIGGAIIGLLGWTTLTVQSIDKKIAVTQVQVEMLSQFRYTAQDADRDRKLTDQRFESQQKEINDLREKLRE